MIFDTLSNAGYCVSLRGPGAEIERGFSTPSPSPAGGGKSRGPAGRGLRRNNGQVVVGASLDVTGKTLRILPFSGIVAFGRKWFNVICIEWLLKCIEWLLK